MARLQKSGDAVERRAKVIAVALLGRAGVERDAHTERRGLAPGLGQQAIQGIESGAQGGRGGCEGGAERIANRLEDVAPVSGDRVTD